MKRIGSLFAVVVLCACSGCASFAVLKSSQQEVRAIKATQLSGGGAGIGIDVSALEAITVHPWLQLGAAAVDAGMIYGGYYLLDAADEKINGKDDEPETKVEINNSPNAQVTVTGDGSPASSASDQSSHEAQ